MRLLRRPAILLSLCLLGHLATAQTAATRTVPVVDTLLQVQDSSILRTIPAAKWESIIKDPGFIYTKRNARPPDDAAAPKPWFDFLFRMFSARVFTILMFILAVGFLLLVIYHLFFSGGMGRYSRKQTEAMPDEPVADDVMHFHDWEKALADACAKGQYRIAVRLLYLQTLQLLNEKALIRFQSEKTNQAYRRELQATKYATSFNILTRYFDYIWYGEFDIDDTQYGMIATLYKNFQHEIR